MRYTFPHKKQHMDTPATPIPGDQKKLIIIGLSTTAEHVYSFVRNHGLYQIAGFAVHQQYLTTPTFKGLPVYPLETLNQECDLSSTEVFVAILWDHLNRNKKNVYEYCKLRGYKMANLISPHAIIRGEIAGDNVWVHDYVIIQNGARIESNAFIMAFTHVGPDSHVGKHVHMSARSLLGGSSRIGEQSFIGLSATVFDETIIGRKCIVGACTAVKRNMPDCSRWIGTGDYAIKQYSEDVIEDKLVAAKNIR